MRLGRSALALATTLPLLAGCGSGGFPDPGPCASPTPISLRPGATTSEVAFAYRRAVDTALDRIEALSSGFTDRWPERELKNHAEFRTDFVAFAHAVRCEAEGLTALEPPPTFSEFHGTLESHMGELAAIMEDGLGAVRSRNVSEFRRWDRRERTFITGTIPELRAAMP